MMGLTNKRQRGFCVNLNKAVFKKNPVFSLLSAKDRITYSIVNWKKLNKKAYLN